MKPLSPGSKGMKAAPGFPGEFSAEMKKPPELSFNTNPTFSPGAFTEPRLKLTPSDASDAAENHVLGEQLGTFREEQLRGAIASPRELHTEQPMHIATKQLTSIKRPAAPGPVLPEPPKPQTPAQVKARDHAFTRLFDRFSSQPDSPENLRWLGERLEFFRPLHETEGHFLYEGICDRLVQLKAAKLNFLREQKQWPYLSDLADLALVLQEIGPDPDTPSVPLSSTAGAGNKREREILSAMSRIVAGCRRWEAPDACSMLVKGLSLLLKKYPDAPLYQAHLQACLATWSNDQLQRLSVLTDGGIPSFPDVSAAKILAT
jgi:hypothetical protein